MNKILCICPNPAIDCFSFLENNITAGKTNKIKKEIWYPGGKGVHVAMGIRELGLEVDLVGIWAGSTGDWIIDELSKLGINPLGISVKGFNRINTTFRAASEWNDTELVGAGPVIDENEILAFIKNIENIIDHYSILVMSGSWPAGAPIDAYAMLIKLCNKKNKKVILDCSGEQLYNSLLQKPFMLHINKSEMEQNTPKEYLKNPMDYYLKFVEVIAITAGAEGLFLSSKETNIHSKCTLDRIISAVGSGDCLTAGLAVATSRSYNFEETAKLATACGSANCIREELGMFYKKDVELLLTKTIVTKIQA
jgi:tagatose 6-phosphate kinase